jgi:hypothetical protein
MPFYDALCMAIDVSSYTFLDVSGASAMDAPVMGNFSADFYIL